MNESTFKIIGFPGERLLMLSGHPAHLDAGALYGALPITGLDG